MFDHIRAFYDAGTTVTEIAQKLGFGRRRVYRWVRRIDLPERNAMAPKPCTPAYFGAFLARRRVEGTTKVRQPFGDIRHRGCTGSYSHLTRSLPGATAIVIGASAEFGVVCAGYTVPGSADGCNLAEPRGRTMLRPWQQRGK